MFWVKPWPLSAQQASGVFVGNFTTTPEHWSTLCRYRRKHVNVTVIKINQQNGRQLQCVPMLKMHAHHVIDDPVVCTPVRGDDPRALASGLSPV